MIKYRRLQKEELETLEEDFIKFLSANSIPASDWEKLKNESPDRVDDLLDVFSNTVLEKVYSKASHLIIVNPNKVLAFYMGADSASLIGVEFNDNTLDLLKNNKLDSVFSSEVEFSSHDPKLFTLEKKYSKPKAEEVYFLVNQGAELVDKKWFEFLKKLKTTIK